MTRKPAHPAAAFGAIFGALYAAHQVADHWAQTEGQAANKGRPGREGWTANLGHVASYTAVAAGATLAANRRFGLGLKPNRILAGLAFSAVTHSWADRRHTLRWLAGKAGHAEFYALGAPRPHHVQGKAIARPDNPCLGTGAYALDQSFHIGALAVAAAIVAGRA